MTDRRRAIRRARLYLVCDVRPDALVAAALRGGVDVVQLRAKLASDDEVIAAGRRYRAVCATHGALLIVNDRPDLAVAAGADGVHVGQDDLAVSEARGVIGPDRLIGLSTHTTGQVDAAALDPEVDYIGVGPVYVTPTKPGRPPVGLALVGYAAGNARQPFFAIGGIAADNAAEVHRAGASRIAVVRAICDSPDPEQAAASLRTAITTMPEEAQVGTAS